MAKLIEEQRFKYYWIPMRFVKTAGAETFKFYVSTEEKLGGSGLSEV